MLQIYTLFGSFEGISAAIVFFCPHRKPSKRNGFCWVKTKKAKKYAVIKKSCTFAAENEFNLFT